MKVGFEENTGLVWKVIHRFFGGGTNSKNYGMEQEDYYQIGCIGLWKAVQNFDESRGNQFSTYAVPMILGEITRYLRDNGMMIKMPRRVKEVAYKIRREKLELSVEEIMERFELDEKYAVMVGDVFKVQFVKSVDEEMNEEGFSILDTLEDESDSFEDFHHKSALEERLSILSDRDRDVILMSLSGKTQAEVGQAFGISQVQVSRIIKRSIDKIQDKFGGQAI